MAAAVQITFRDIPHSDAVASHVERRAAKLETFCQRIIKCHVVVEAPHKHSQHGQRFHVLIDMCVPGKELVVSKNIEDATLDLHAAIDDAFADAERVLDTYAQRLRLEVKPHAKQPRGVVAKLFPERGYGFILAEEDREVYFHRNSVIDTAFEKLKIGASVRFVEEDGDMGPQASTVHVLSN